MTASIRSDIDLDTVKSDIAALRGDVAALIEHLRQNASEGASAVHDEIGHRVNSLGKEAARDGRDAADALTAWVSQRPVLASLIALCVGYVGARALLR